MNLIGFIVTALVGCHVVGAIAMLVREWWLFRKSKVRARKITEPPKTEPQKVEPPKYSEDIEKVKRDVEPPKTEPQKVEPPKYSDEIEKVKRDVELAAEIRRILAKSTVRHDEGDYEFDANKLTASEYQLLLNYAKERKKELDSYVDLCNKISDEPEADCSEEMKLIYGNIDLIELAKFVDAFSNKHIVGNGGKNEQR